MTLVFPDSLPKIYPRVPPPADEICPGNGSVQNIPSTSSPLLPISQDTTLAFALPDSEAPEFLAGIQELPNGADWAAFKDKEESPPTSRTGWVMKAAASKNPSRSKFRTSIGNAWTGFVDLVKVSGLSPVI